MNLEQFKLEKCQKTEGILSIQKTTHRTIALIKDVLLKQKSIEERKKSEESR